jgi:mRNA interferase MazF
MYQKKFDEWNVLKQDINDKKAQITIRVGDVRWIMFGTNVGSEIDGKGQLFLRPGLVMNVIGHDLALVVPMTSKEKQPPRYIPFEANGRSGSLCLHQMKVISQNRILHRIERISDTRLSDVRQQVAVFFELQLKMIEEGVDCPIA